MKSNSVMLRALFLIVFIVAVSQIASAIPPPPPDPTIPIDGGISLLIAAGIGYGAKKMYDSRKK